MIKQTNRCRPIESVGYDFVEHRPIMPDLLTFDGDTTTLRLGIISVNKSEALRLQPKYDLFWRPIADRPHVPRLQALTPYKTT